MSSADDQYEQQNDVTGGDVPSGDSVDNDYKSRTGQHHIPVQSDEAPVSDPIDPATADSDETLGMTPPPPTVPHAVLWAGLLLIPSQPRMTVMQLIRATSLVDAHEDRSPVEDTLNLEMKKGCLERMMEHRQLAERYPRGIDIQQGGFDTA